MAVASVSLALSAVDAHAVVYSQSHGHKLLYLLSVKALTQLGRQLSLTLYQS